MAIQLLQENGKFNTVIKHFLIDDENDLTNLDTEYVCTMGDKAELPNGTIYIRHSDDFQGDLWEERNSNSSNSSSENNDFTIVTLTVENNEEGDISIYIPNIYEENIVTNDSPALIGSEVLVSSGDTQEISVVLYKGTAWGIISGETEGIDTEGSVTTPVVGNFFITGNGSLKFGGR